MKHELERLGTDGFEKLIQALMSKLFGIRVKIYGDGPDRQREALIKDAHNTVCDGVEALGRTIIQAKFKSPDGSAKDWTWLKDQLKKELDGFSKKAKSEPEFVPETWIFFTNLILTPASGGLKDKADAFVAGYKTLIPHIYVLGADEIRALLDAHPEVARRYAAFLTPSDVLSEAYDYLKELRLEPLQNLMEHIRQRFQAEAPVRLEQAGALDNRIDVRHVYTDMEAIERGGNEQILNGLAASILRLGDRPHPRSARNTEEPPHKVPEYNLVLIGSAGQGKSTLCQYICQLYRAALLEHYHPEMALARGYSQEVGIPKPNCKRFPLLIRLKDYAAWLGKLQEGESGSVLHYLALQIQKDTEGALPAWKLRKLFESYSWFFFFDGLDEVPASSNREELLGHIRTFLTQDLTETHCDSLVICTSRPQGYDGAFSRSSFRHLELRDMSRSLCMRYVDRLLQYLEPDGTLREKYHRTLEQSLDDPLIAKLMVTPLYTSILVLLVKSGSTPPKKRFKLFQEYSNTVIRREKQKKLLPYLYEGDDSWIDELHGQIAFLLQRESETAENAAAELTLSRCRDLIDAYLVAEKWQGSKKAKKNELLRAMTERLPFLKLTTTAKGERCVLFPLRSVQEFFAAKHLLRIEDTEARYDTLRAISRSAYWRNVFLFAAGAFSDAGTQSADDVIYSICCGNNGKKENASPEQKACSLALSGSRLALDLLCDNLFERRQGQDRYLELAAMLLEWANPSASLLERFSKLPPALLSRCIRNYAIPRVRKTKDPNEAAFSLLWKAAQDGNSEARTQLEALADALSLPTRNTVDHLLGCSWEGLGPKLLRRMISWVTEFHASHYLYRSIDIQIKRLIHWSRTAEKPEGLPAEVKRLAAYRMFIHYSLFYLPGAFEVLYTDHFLSSVQVALGKKPGKRRVNALSLRTCFQIPPGTPDWASLKTLFSAQGFPELAALAAFRLDPSAERIGNLLEAMVHLPAGLFQAFLLVLREQDWLLRELAEALEAGESLETLRLRYDEAAIRRCQEREAAILLALEKQDYAALSGIHVGKRLDIYVLDPNRQDFSAFLGKIPIEAVSTRGLRTYDDLPDPSRTALLSRFSVCFNDWGIAAVALEAFAETPVHILASEPLSYPTALPQFEGMGLARNHYPAILERLEALCRLGGPYVNAYALVPYIFKYADTKDLRRLAESAASHYEHVKAGGNDCALLGVILLLLMGEIPAAMYGDLREELERLLASGVPASLWQLFSQHFSLAGDLLAHEAGMAAFKGSEEKTQFFWFSRHAILQSLEALPAERDKVPDQV